MPGTIDKVTGPLSYVIKLPDGSIIHCHIDHIKARENHVDDNADCIWDYIDSNIGESTAAVPVNIPEQSTQQTVRRSEHI